MKRQEKTGEFIRDDEFLKRFEYKDPIMIAFSRNRSKEYLNMLLKRHNNLSEKAKELHKKINDRGSN